MLIRFPRPPMPLNAWQTRIGFDQSARTGRSWWALLYTDGHTLQEWEPDVGSPNGHQDWSRLANIGKLAGVRAIRLYCPNGKLAELGGTVDNTGRIFQLKIGTRSIAINSNGQPLAESRDIQAHVIGIISGTDGQCECFAWELLPEPQPPKGAPKFPGPDPALRAFDLSIPVAELEAQHIGWLGLKKQWDGYTHSPAVRLWEHEHKAWEEARGGRLVGPWSDNAYAMRYHNIGALNAGVLGLHLS